jgi:hypothetical protein
MLQIVYMQFAATEDWPAVPSRWRMGNGETQTWACVQTIHGIVRITVQFIHEEIIVNLITGVYLLFGMTLVDRASIFPGDLPAPAC